MDETIIGQKIAQELLQLSNHIEPILFRIFISIFIAAIFYSLFKVIIMNISNYLLFRWDQYLGIGTLVEINSMSGRIKNYSIFYILIETNRGYIRIPMSSWRGSNILILKNEIQRKGK